MRKGYAPLGPIATGRSGKGFWRMQGVRGGGPWSYLAIAATDPARLTTVAPVPSTRDQAAKGASVT